MRFVEDYGVHQELVLLRQCVSELAVSKIVMSVPAESRFYVTDCKTTSDNSCVFPFKYKGKTYSTCTRDESVNGIPWCATKVDRSGNVVRWWWEDCKEECPGTSFDFGGCYFGDLFNAQGKCINKRRAINLERKFGSGVLQTIKLDRSSSGQEEAPKCLPNFN